MIYKSRQRAIIALIVIIVVVLDRITKQIIVHSLEYNDIIRVGGGKLLWIMHVRNPGMAFGMEFFPPWFLAVIAAIASILIGWYIFFRMDVHYSQSIPLALIMGGALGNLADRFIYGQVIDFLSVDFPDFIMTRFPVFNVADSAISVGVTLMVILTFFIRKDEDETTQIDVQENDESCMDDEKTGIIQ